MMDMIIIYEECGFNERAALALYRQRFGERPNQPYRQQFPKLHARLLDRGTFDARPGPVQGAPFPRRVRTPEAVALVRQTFEGRPNTSVRATGMALGMSKTTVHEMVRSDLHLKPWKRAQVQKLKPGDPPIRARVCKEFMDLVDEAQANPLFPGDRFVNRVIWSDECLVSNEGYFNAHNSHHWAPEDDNPHCTIQTHVQGRFKVMVWAGILRNKVVGPYFFEGAVTAVTYTALLQHHLPGFLEDFSLQVHRSCWFMQDGASPHTSILLVAAVRITIANFVKEAPKFAQTSLKCFDYWRQKRREYVLASLVFSSSTLLTPYRALHEQLRSVYNPIPNTGWNTKLNKMKCFRRYVSDTCILCEMNLLMTNLDSVLFSAVVGVKNLQFLKLAPI
ncbi:uncharacterized protein LOC127751721 [Frankliniella occidentalis]|uniref:Uncharacterized protein LOC127751721 n=1 Tax=Frankliniella occidentalis TaxID=133901 RepID=A0A9C6X9M5_FRAOC|nr:uncharacterized protein LOC127751721 [Frankliniella occidentalis]